MKGVFGSSCIVAVVVLSGAVVFGQNYKIKQTTSVQGQTMASTVFVKGTRKRTESSGMMGMGADVATIEQCDLNRTVQVNDKKKLYYVSENRAAAATVTPGSARPVAAKTPKGGTVTQTTNITDNGERKQMFGLTARHIKTTMTMTSSPDACSKDDMSMETDGWYVDLPMFSCPVPVPRNPYSPGAKGGCQDTVVTKFTGGGKIGFPLEMTQTIHSGGSDMEFSQTISTIEFSKATLDDALFNVPADYRLAGSPQDLYGRPDFTAVMGGQTDPDDGAGATRMPANTGKKPGTIRIGVLPPTNRNGDNISATNMQAYLASQLTQGKVEGIAVANEPAARAAGCDYLLTSDFSKLKQSTAGKIGGMFGRVTGTPTAGVYDAEVNYALVSLADGKKTLQSKSSNKTEPDVDRAAESVLALEAQAVIAVAK